MSASDSEGSDHADSPARTKGGKSKSPASGHVALVGTKTLPFTAANGDEASGLFCDPCGLKEKSVEANAFCPFCKRYMCVDCQHEHNKATATSNHVMLIGAEMPPARMKQSSRKEVNMCENHSYRMAEFYCPKHKVVFCIGCKDKKHIRCPEVSNVKKVAIGVKSGKDLPTTIQNLRKLVVQMERVKTIKISHHERLEEQLADNIRAVSAYRNELNTLLDNLEKNIKDTIQKKFSKEMADIQDQRTKCEAKVSILLEEIAALDASKTADEPICFIALLKAKEKYLECEQAFENLTKHKRELKLEFEPNQRLLYSLRELDTLGTMKSTIVRPKSACRMVTPTLMPSGDVPSNMLATLKKGKDFVLCGEHSVGSPDDKRTCTVSGSVFLPDGRLLICDSRNNNVKLFDHIIQLKSTMKMPATPYDVTGLKSRDVVVTVPERKELHFAVMDPDLRTTRVVRTEMGCHGIRGHKGGLLTTCYSHGMFGIVLLMDQDGLVLQRFERDYDGNAIFQGPYYLAVNPIRDRFYVTDKAANTVLGLTMGGKVLFR